MKLQIIARRRSVAATILAGALLAGGAQGAQAATIHACVKPKSGATRIVGAKAKCRHGEQKLSWNTAGPRGPAGPNGANGSNGTAGAEGHAGVTGQGPLYFAESKELVEAKVGAPIVTKIVPPGSYSLKGSLLAVVSAKAAGNAEILCGLLDSAGTEGSAEPEDVDLVGWLALLAELEPGDFSAASTIPLEGVLSSKVTSRVEIQCEELAGKGAKLKTETAHIQALQVSSIL